MQKKVNPRIARKVGIRKKISGMETCPRLSVFRSARHMSVQAIDDISGNTIASTTSCGKKNQLEGHCGNKKTSEKLGEIIAEKLLEKGIKKVVFDRNGFLYHGRVKALADGARKKGLIF